MKTGVITRRQFYAFVEHNKDFVPMAGADRKLIERALAGVEPRCHFYPQALVSSKLSGPIIPGNSMMPLLKKANRF